MLNTFTRRVVRVVGFAPALLLIAIPAWSCPVSVTDGEFDLATMDRAQFSPVSTMRMTDQPERAQRAMAAAPCEGGSAGGYPCNNVDLLSFTPLADLGGSEANDIWGWTDPQTGKEYALMGRQSGTSFVDISDPVNPVYLGNLPTHTASSIWRDIKVHDNHAYIVSEASGHGMQVFDLTQLRDVVSPPQTFANTTHYSNFGNAHNIVINEDTAFAYAVGTSTCSGGLHMIDISAPASPVFAGCYAADGYTHDAQCVSFHGPSHRFHHGAELCFNSNEDTVTIVDVTDKSNPVQLARLPYPGSGYTHQGWLTEDHQYFLMDDELDESNFGHPTRTRVFDVSDPADPRLVGQYDSSAAAIDHNMYVLGDYAFQANYRAGLRILKIDDPSTASLSEEGFFDIYPSSDSASFNGAWSTYPYFDSGNVIVSGIEQGLFVLKPTSLVPSFSIDPPDPARLEVCGVGSDSAPLDVVAFGGFTESIGLSVSGAPAGATATLSPDSLVPPGTSTLTVDIAAPAAGQYMLSVDGASSQSSFSTVVNLEVSVAAPSAAAELLPLDGAADVSSNQTLHWEGGDGVYRYDLEIATDPQFNDVIAAATGLTINRYPASSLPGGTTLYWRVTSRNACGAVVSASWSFTTANSSCALYASQDVPKAISSGAPNTVSSALTSNADGQIVDVNVIDLQGAHTYLGDLDFQLEGPLNNAHSRGPVVRHSQRALVRLIERQCASEENFDLSLDDDAPAGALPCPYNDGGTYRPNNSMAPFNGSPGAGDWTLIVNDNANIDGGSLNGWGLEICTTPLPELLDTDGDGVPDQADNCIEVANPDQRETHGDGYGNVCDPDLDNDGNVNVSDLALLKIAFLSSGADLDADFNGDGVVNAIDLAVMKAYFLGPPGPSGVAIE